MDLDVDTATHESSPFAEWLAAEIKAKPDWQAKLLSTINAPSAGKDRKDRKDIAAKWIAEAVAQGVDRDVAAGTVARLVAEITDPVARAARHARATEWLARRPRSGLSDDCRREIRAAREAAPSRIVAPLVEAVKEELLPPRESPSVRFWTDADGPEEDDERNLLTENIKEELEQDAVPDDPRWNCPLLTCVEYADSDHFTTYRHRVALRQHPLEVAGLANALQIIERVRADRCTVGEGVYKANRMWQNGRAWGWTSMSSTGPTSKLDPKKLGYSYELRLVKDYGAGGHPVGFLGDGEAVYCADRLVPESIRVELESYLDWIADAPNKDFHPHVKGIVQDIIHPSLFPLIKKGRAPETPSSDDFLPSLPGEEAEEDQEAVYYQWLPSVFRVYKDGHVEIASSINNVDPSDNLELHDIVANVFSIVLPLLSKCVSMSRFAKKYENPCLRLPIVRQWNNERQKQHTLDRSLYPDPNGEEEYKELQVIVKAANYILEPGQHYSGTWHVEGEPHEKIIASAIYYYASSAGIEDMGLAFRRRRSGYDYPCKEDYYRADITRLVSRDVLDRDDKTKLYQDVRESDSWRYETDGALQFGSVQTRENRVLVFPNSLQHRVRGISAYGRRSGQDEIQSDGDAEVDDAEDDDEEDDEDESGDGEDGNQEQDESTSAVERMDETAQESNASRATGPLTRKILCFFLVDPDSPIATTADLPPRRWNSKRRTQLSILVSHAARTKGFELPDEVVRMVVGFAKDGLSWQEACAHRLELMHHRKYTKNEQNQAVEREFSLCEH